MLLMAGIRANQHAWHESGHYLTYPGTFFQADFFERVIHACTILANDYLTKNEPENARESLNNIYHAHYVAKPEKDPFQSFLTFQKKWEEMMGIVGEKRTEIQKWVFGIGSD